MKKFTSLILILTLVIMAFAGCESKPKESPASDFEYEINDGKVTITRYIGKDADVVIPEKIEDYPVVEIESAFMRIRTVETVYIPDTVVSISHGAFEQCSSLVEVRLPKSLETIGDIVFRYCCKLEKLSDLPKTLKSIGTEAFANCVLLTEAKIPEGCTLGERAFVESGLAKVELGEGITAIPYQAFALTNISKIVIPSSVKTIGSEAFAGCEKLAEITLSENLETIESGAFARSAVGEITIPASVSAVEESVFGHCEKLQTVRFEGNAPSGYINEFYRSGDGAALPEYTVYYHEGAEGFTSPEWNGYKTQTW